MGKVKIGTEDFVRPAEGGVYVKPRVSPRAKSTSIKGLYGESAIKLSVAAPPVEGKANAQMNVTCPGSSECLARAL